MNYAFRMDVFGQVLASFTLREYLQTAEERKVIRVPLYQLLRDLLSYAIVLECRSSCKVRQERIVMQIRLHRFVKMVKEGRDRGITTLVPLDRMPVQTKISERRGYYQNRQHTTSVSVLNNTFSATASPLDNVSETTTTDVFPIGWHADPS